MGNGTPLTSYTIDESASGTTRQAGRPLRLSVDIPLILIVITLLAFGLLMVYSASWDYSIVVLEKPPTYMFVHQLRSLGIGILVMIVLSRLDYRHWKKLALPLMLINLGLLVAVLVIGEVVNNATRTIFRGSVQPSEFAKLMTVVYLSVWLYNRRDQLNDISFGLIPLGAILGVLAGLIVVQPDLSAAATVCILGGILFFLAGSDLRQIGAMGLIGLLSGLVILRLHPTGRMRIDAYLAGLSDPSQAPTHLARSLEAIVKGGWLGVGIGRADTKLIGLPVPPTDSIFAVISEETGILGSSALILLYVLLLWRGFKIARDAPDDLGRLMAMGLSVWIIVEGFINMAVMVGLVPFAGNALPFISYGGSSLVASLAAVGILLNISRTTTKLKTEEERTFHAVVDLRRRDWRGSVPRSRYPSSNPDPEHRGRTTFR